MAGVHQAFGGEFFELGVQIGCAEPVLMSCEFFAYCCREIACFAALPRMCSRTAERSQSRIVVAFLVGTQHCGAREMPGLQIAQGCQCPFERVCRGRDVQPVFLRDVEEFPRIITSIGFDAVDLLLMEQMTLVVQWRSLM